MPRDPKVFVPYCDLLLDYRAGIKSTRITIAGERVDEPLRFLLEGLESPQEREQTLLMRARFEKPNFPPRHVVIDNSINIDGDVTSSQVAGEMTRARHRTGRPADEQEG